MKKKLLLLFFCSILLFLITCWSAALSGYAAGFTESICYFALTYYALLKFSEMGMNDKNTIVILTIILGRIILEIPVRFMDFRGSLASLGITVVVLTSILLALLCFREKRISVFILSTIIIVLLNTFGLYTWEQSFSQTGIPSHIMNLAHEVSDTL